jgi:hypothetical protein
MLAVKCTRCAGTLDMRAYVQGKPVCMACYFVSIGVKPTKQPVRAKVLV